MPDELPCSEDKAKRPAFSFALKQDRSATEGLDHLINELHRHAHDPDAIRQAAGAMRHTVETSLWQGAHREGSQLPAIHAELLGRATGLFVADKLRWIATTVRDWLVLLSSPRRILWAVEAAWRGDEVADHVHQRAGWHSVDEIAVFQRDREVPIVRVGAEVSADEDDWLASSPVLCAPMRTPVNRMKPDGLFAASPIDKPLIQTLVVIGDKSEITARVTGHPPPGLKEELQSLCVAADGILGDTAAGRAEWIFRLKQIVTPALKKTGPKIAEKFWNPLALLTLFLTAGAALLGSAGVEHLRWEGVVRQLDSEPGIEIISHSSAWGQRQIEMLRDPQARNVTELLLHMGCNPAAVVVRERPFISAEEPLLVAREQSQLSFARQISSENLGARELSQPSSSGNASTPAGSDEIRDRVLAEVRLDLLRSVLDLPSDLELELSGGELTARGVLGEPAYSRLANASRKLGWLRKINLDQVRDLIGENIDGLRKGLESISIEFVPASAILPEASKLRLQSVASEMGLLAADARLKQTAVHVQFCARHEAMDTSTIEHRVAVIRHDLERQGVPALWFIPGMDFLDAPGPNAIGFRINLEPPSSTP